MSLEDFADLENLDGFSRMSYRHERSQGDRLAGALHALQGNRKLWVVSPERDVDVGDRKSTPDVILYFEKKGFIVLDFKTTNPRWDKESDGWEQKNFRPVLKQAQAIWDLFKDEGFRETVAQRAEVRLVDVPTKPPPIVPIVGFDNVSQATCDGWTEYRKSTGRREVAIIGEETWKEAEDASRGNKIIRMIEKAMPEEKLPRNWEPPLIKAVFQTLGDFAPPLQENERLSDLEGKSQYETLNELPRGWSRVTAELSSEEAEDIFETTDGDKILKWAVVAGPAGTGKTWLAAYGAMEAARRDLDVLLAFRSPHLTDHIRRVIDDFQNEYGLLTEEQRDRIVVEPVNPKSNPGGVVGLEGWNKFLDRVQRNRFDVVLVDEAQDFSDEATKPRSVMSLVAEAAKEQGQVVLFGDREQVTSSEAGGIPWAPPDERVILKLERNFRSQPLIVDSIMELTGVEYEIFQPDLSKLPEDFKPRVAAPADPSNADEIAKAIGEQLQKMDELSVARPVSERSAVILSIDDQLKEQVEASQAYKKWKRQYRRLDWKTVDDFKGLEAEFVVLVVTSPNRDSGATWSVQELKPHIYTGYSRARLLLGVIDATGLLG